MIIAGEFKECRYFDYIIVILRDKTRETFVEASQGGPFSPIMIYYLNFLYMFCFPGIAFINLIFRLSKMTTKFII